MATETVTLKLPSGEMVDAIVPAGLDDAGVKSLMQMKHPDVFGPPAQAAGPHVQMQEMNMLDPSNAGAPSRGVTPAGKLSGLPGVNPHVPTFSEGVSDVSLAGTPMLAAMPATTAAKALAGATLGSYGAKKGAEAAGLEKTGQELAATAGGIVGGGAASQMKVPDIPEVVKAGAMPTAKAVAKTVDAVTFNRASAIWNAWKEVPAEIRAKIAENAPPTPPAAPPADMQSAPGFSKAEVGKKLDVALNEATGGKPLRPGVKLRDQGQPAATALPRDSAVVKDFKYDPAANELHVTTKDGITYVSGDVSEAQADAFKSAESKGQAWKAVRDNSPLVAKIIDGKRIAMKGPSGMRSAAPAPDGDLLLKLQQSVEQALQKRAGR